MKIYMRFIYALIDSIRPFLGPDFVCIFDVSCTKFAKTMLDTRNIIVATLFIVVRILLCNPATGLVLTLTRKKY